MPRGNAFEAEYAKSNMATCRVCMAKIPKGVLRVGHLQLEEEPAGVPAAARDDEGDAPEKEEDPFAKEAKRMMAVAAATRWHHFECFNKMKGAKWMAANLPRDPSSIRGFGDLTKQDQRRLSALWKAILMGGTAAAAGKRRAAGSADARGAKKRRAADGSAAITKLTSVRGVLKPRDFKRVQRLEEELASATTAQLQAELLKNNQVRGGKKEELVRRVAEGRHLGALPPCPRCEKGRLHWNRVGGWYSCPGHFDQEAKIQRRCNYRTQEMKRARWLK